MRRPGPVTTSLQGDAEFRQSTTELGAAIKQGDPDPAKIEELLKQRLQRAETVARDSNADLSGIRAAARSRQAPRSIGKHAIIKASKGSPTTQARSGDTEQKFDEFTFASFPDEEVRAGSCGATTISESGRIVANHPDVQAQPGVTCESTVWRHVTLNPAPKGNATAYITYQPSQLLASASKGSYARAVAGIRFTVGSVDTVCEFSSADSEGSTAKWLALGVFSDPMVCKLGTLPSGVLRVGPWVGVSTFASAEDPAAWATGSATLKPLEIRIEIAREGASDPGKLAPAPSRPSRGDPTFDSTPVTGTSMCLAPVIALPTENKVFEKGPITLSVKAPQTPVAQPGNTATISIDRVGGGNASHFDMALNSTQDLGPLLGQNADGTFPADAVATYTITATINPKNSVQPVSCPPSAPRAFRIAKPARPRPSRPDSPPNLLHEEKPNPTSPPPVEQMQQMNQGR